MEEGRRGRGRGEGEERGGEEEGGKKKGKGEKPMSTFQCYSNIGSFYASYTTHFVCLIYTHVDLYLCIMYY